MGGPRRGRVSELWCRVGRPITRFTPHGSFLVEALSWRERLKAMIKLIKMIKIH